MALIALQSALTPYDSYIVIEKRDLTVSVAFTAISLFTMLRLPLNIIPSYVSICDPFPKSLGTNTSADRGNIAVFGVCSAYRGFPG